MRQIVLALAFGVCALLLSAHAGAITFVFDPDSLVQSYPASAGDQNVTGENKISQVDARRVHQEWASTFYETFYNPVNPQTQAYSYNTYVNWAEGLGEGEGISCFNIWLLDNPAARSWGETLVTDPDAAQSTLSATAVDGWTADVIANPWGDGWLIQWSTTQSANYINWGSDIGDFSFSADLYVDTDENGYDTGDPEAVIGSDYRIWFGAGNAPNDYSLHFDNQWGTRLAGATPFAAGDDAGYEGVLVPEPISMVMLGCLGVGMAAARKLRRQKS